MKLGLLSDVHEKVELLALTLARFRQQRVDQIVILGDLYETGTDLEETCRLLDEAGAVGVWGNHDFFLCGPRKAEERAEYGRSVQRVMQSLQPRLELADCHFSHVEPWLNPESLHDLRYYDGRPDEHRKFDRIFDAVPNRLLFAGHFHKWLIVRPDGIVEWDAIQPIRLERGRYFVVVGAVCEGDSAIYDTETCELTPFRDPCLS
ncbi:MAG: metallophosphoesterase family protein [Planctomycetaceae bacterium]|jgi:predicted phosphodiesterase